MKRKSLLFLLLFALIAPWAANAQETITLTGDLTQAIVPGTTYTFYDSGGPDSNYGTSQNYTATFTCDGEITINFSQFATESSSGCSNWDYMLIYDGTTLLGRGQTGCSNNIVTIGTDIVAESGTLKIEWHSDSSVTGAGWTATITGAAPASCPKPTGVAASDPTAHGATISWTGSSDSYIVMVGQPAVANSYDFESNAIPTDFTNDATNPWTVVANTHSGAYCAKSAGGFTSTNSDLVLTVDLAREGSVDFSAMVSSEQNWDYGRFLIDGAQKFEVSGYTNSSWIDYSYPLAAGSHTLTWRYYKDGSGNHGDDCFYVDDIVINMAPATWDETHTASVSPYTFTDLDPETTYLVKVKGICGGEQSEPSATVSFTTLESCPTPQNLAVTTDGTTATVTWSGVEGACNIDIDGTVTENVTSPYTFNVQLSTTYTIKVQAACGSNWTAPYTFTTPDCLGGRTIEYTLVDSYGDGWNGNAINIVDECGAIINTLTLASGSSTSGTLEFCEGYYEFVFLEGGYKAETSWTFTEGGVTLFSGYGEDVVSGEVLYTTGNPTKPTDIRATPDTNSAELSWSENGTATAWQICLDGDEANLIAANTNPFTLTGLVPGNIYGVKVRSVNGGTYTCWSEALAFTTTESCDAPTVPTVSGITPFAANVAWTPAEGEFELRYRELAPQDNYFEDGTLGAWTTIDADGDGKDWYGLATEDIPGYNGSTGLATSASYQGGALTPDNYLVSPQVTLGGSISFWACNQDAYAETIGVAVSTASNDDPADFTTLKTVTLPITRGGAYTTDSRSGRRAQTPWVYIYVDLSAYAGQTGYVAIRHYNCTDKFRVNVDNIMIEQPGDEWTVVSNATSPVALTDLTPETDYEVEVRTACHADYSRWMSEVFSTPSNCEAPTNVNVPAETLMPTTAVVEWNGYQDSYEVWYRPVATGAVLLEDDFEDGTLNNWTMVDADGDGDNWQIATPASYGIGDAYSGTYCASSWSWNGDTYYPDNYMISPLVDGAASITYYVATNMAYPDHYAVMASSTGTDISDFTTVFEEDAYSGSKGNGTKSSMIKAGTRAISDWAEKTVQLPAGTKYVAFRHYNSDDMNYLFIDDVTIYGAAGEEQEWMQATTDGTSIILGEDVALIPETTYECKVHGENRSCTEGEYEGFTEFSETITFTTPGYCDKPNSFVLDDLTSTSATLSWTGFQDSYNVFYYSAPVEEYLYEDFSTGVSGWTVNSNFSGGRANIGDEDDPWYCVYFNSNGQEQILYSPEMEGVVEGSTLEFTYIAIPASETGSSVQSFYVGFSSDFETFTYGEVTTTSEDEYYGYYQVEVPAGTKYFAIKSTGASDYLCVTDFIVYGPNYQPAGEFGYGDLVVETNSATLEPLEPGKEYYVLVQGICGEGEDDVTDWVAVSIWTLEGYTQTVELFEGWNWFSTYIELDDPVELLQMLENGMGDSGIQIESVIDGVEMNGGDMWAGDLMSIGLMNEHTYMIEVMEDVTVELQGPATNPADHPITIYPNEYSWIGFPSAEEVDVNVALAGLEAEEGDMIETVYGDEGGIIYYYGGVWVGEFDTMIPGRGYIYFSNSDEEKTLIIQTGEEEEEEGKSSANSTSSLNLNNIKANVRTILDKASKQSKINSANTTQSMYKIQTRFKRAETAILQSKINK